MDYKSHYARLITRAQNRTRPDGYTERHHIIPRCMGGSNASLNIAVLTAEEHYVAHQLLVKMYPCKPKLRVALFMLTNKLAQRNNKVYAWIKQRHAEAMRELNLGTKHSPQHIEKMRIAMSGEKNPMFGKLHSVAARAKISAGLTLEIRAKMSLLATGRKHTPASNEKNRQAHLGKKCTPKHKAILSKLNSGSGNPMYGKRLSDESIARMVASKVGVPNLKLLGRPLSEIHRKKLSDAKQRRTPEQVAAAAEKRVATIARNQRLIG